MSEHDVPVLNLYLYWSGILYLAKDNQKEKEFVSSIKALSVLASNGENNNIIPIKWGNEEDNEKDKYSMV